MVRTNIQIRVYELPRLPIAYSRRRITWKLTNNDPNSLKKQHWVSMIETGCIRSSFDLPLFAPVTKLIFLNFLVWVLYLMKILLSFSVRLFTFISCNQSFKFYPCVIIGIIYLLRMLTILTFCDTRVFYPCFYL